jgi:hypothetical protein
MATDCRVCKGFGGWVQYTLFNRREVVKCEACKCTGRA